jgi:arsenate reductase
MKKVLFVCVHNSARSQMAEAFLNERCAGFFEAHSAGLEPGTLNPLAVEAMRDLGIDLSRHRTKSVESMLRSGLSFSHVITVCDGASAERCPVFPGAVERLHWSFPDPSTLTGPRDARLERVRQIRDAIRDQVQSWCTQVCVEFDCCAADRC